MTFPATNAKRKATVPSAGQVTFGLFALFCLLLILRNAELAIAYVNTGLKLCAKAVVPSLFPFMVLSELIVSGASESQWIKRLTKPLQRLFGLPAAGCTAALLGMLCGFPVGAKCAMLSYERGELTKKEAQHVLLFSNNPSSAFLISAVGVSLWESRAFGVMLYAITLSVSLLTGFLYRFLQRKEEIPTLWGSPLPSSAPLSGARLFTNSIASATGSILLVCAYVVFFSVLTGTLNLCLGALRLPSEISSLISCLLELSGGVSKASTLSNAPLAALLCAFAAGWSGLSVHCQVLSVCDGKGLSFGPYFIAKLIQGILCALLMGVAVYFCPALLQPQSL